MAEKQISHGRASYCKMICRCQICTDAHNEYSSKWKRDRTVGKLNAKPLIEVSLKSPTFNIRPDTLNNILENGVDVFTADRYCIEMGYHPMQLYGFKFYQEPKRPHGYVELV